MKVLIIDDHALFREGLRYLLCSMTNDLEYVEAENVKRLPYLSREHPVVDLILLDLNIGGTDGLVAIGDLQTLWQETPIVIVTASERQEDIERAMAAGAVTLLVSLPCYLDNPAVPHAEWPAWVEPGLTLYLLPGTWGVLIVALCELCVTRAYSSPSVERHRTCVDFGVCNGEMLLG